MKKIISLLLLAVMTLAVVPFTGYADDFSDLFPTLDGGSEGGSVAVEIDPDADLSYLRVLVELGIIDEADTEPENVFRTVSRGKTVRHILKLLGYADETISGNEIRGYFTDVTSDTPYASEIEFAANIGIVSGLGDGTFNPEGQISYNEVLKLVIAALGYNGRAEANGGYYFGHYLTATSLKLTKNAPHEEVNLFGTVCRILYNALNTKTLSGTFANTDVEYTQNDSTLLKEKFAATVYTGIVEAVGQNSIYGFSEQTNNQITISGQRFECSVENPMDYIGRKVRFFAKEDETSIYENVFTMEIMPVNTVTSFDIEDVTEPENDRIYYEGEEKEQYVKISDEANILYNGRGIAYDKQMIAPVDNNINAPMEGDITCIDNDGDNKVDVVIVNSYWSFYADSVIAKQGMIADYYYTKVNPDIRFYQFLKPGEDENQKIYKNDKEISMAEIKSKNVVSVQKSNNGISDTLNLIVTDTKVSGVVSAIDSEGILTINGKQYELSEYYKYMQRVAQGHAPIFNLGDTVEVNLDPFGKIAGCSKRSRKTTGDYFFMFGFDGGRNRLILDVMNNNGAYETLTVTETIKYKGLDDSEAVRTNPGEIFARWETAGYVNAPIRVLKDSEGNVKSIEMVKLIPVPSAEISNGNILINDVSSQYLKEIGQTTIANTDYLTVSGKTTKFGIGYGAPGAPWDETNKRAENFNLPVYEDYSYKMTTNLANTTGSTNLLKAHVDMIYVADYDGATNEIGLLVVDTLPNDETHNAVFVNAEKTAAEMARKYPSIASFGVASNYANPKSNGVDLLAKYFGEWARFDVRDTRVTTFLMVNKVVETKNEDGDTIRTIIGLNNGKEVQMDVRPDCVFWSTTTYANAPSWFAPVDLYDMEANAELAQRYYQDYNGQQPEILPGDVYAFIKKPDGSIQELYFMANMDEGPGKYGAESTTPVSRHNVSFGGNMKWGFCFGAVHGINGNTLYLRDRSQSTTGGSFTYSVQNGVDVQEFTINSKALYMWDFEQRKFIVADRNQHLVPSYMCYSELPESTYTGGSKIGQRGDNNVWMIVGNQHWAQNIEMIFADYYDAERYYED